MKYWVTEKSDGIRAFMLLDKEGTFFVDRRFDFYRLDDEKFSIPDANNMSIEQDQVTNFPFLSE
jgi:hypothetical protein